MKNLFSFNVNTEEQPYNGYVIKEAAPDVSDAQTDALKKINEFQKKYSLPVYFRIIEYICGFGAAIIVCSLFSVFIEGTSLSTAYKNAPYIFYIGGTALIIFLILFGISGYLLRKGEKDPELQIIAEEAKSTVARSFEELGVPESAAEISVIVYLFKLNKRGKEKSAALPFTKYGTIEMRIYADGDNLYLADLSSVTAIPFSDIGRIVENKKRVQVPEWTKDEDFRSPKYKPYKVKRYQYGYTVKTYSMQVGADCEVIIPNYEIETLKSFVNAPVTELKQKQQKKDA